MRQIVQPTPGKIEANSARRTVVLADPRSFMRDCLACWLGQSGEDYQLVVTVDAAATIARPHSTAPAAVLLGVPGNPEGRTWLRDQVSALRTALSELPIAVLVDDQDLAEGQESVLRMGLQGYIPLASTTEIAVAALRLVIAGGRYFPHVRAAERRQAARSGPAPARFNGKLRLTPREQAVFDLLAAGLPNKRIARELDVALSTVKIHVHHILEKLNVHNRTEVAIWGKSRAATGTEQFVERRQSRQIATDELR